MRLLLCSEVFYPFGSGGELATYLWTRLLSRYVRVTLVTARISKEVEDELKALGVNVVLLEGIDVSTRMRFWLSLKKHYDSLRKLISDHDLVLIPRLSYPLIPIVRSEGRPVIVHLHDYVAIDPSGIALAPRFRYSMIDVLGMRNYIRRLLAIPMWRNIIKYLDIVNSVIFVSERQKDIICSKRPSLCKEYAVIYNPLPKISIKTSASLPYNLERAINHREYVLFCGGFSKVKGFNIVKILAKIFSKYNIMTIITKTNTSSYDESLNILAVPRLNYDEYLLLLKGAKALLHPSIYEEPLPYAVLEALAMNTPVIATDVGGIPEILGREYPIYIQRINDVHYLKRVVEGFIKGYDIILDYMKHRKRYIEEVWSDNALINAFISVLNKHLSK
ncbi:MAG: glycosyltransferase family 4 protein [Sulfolobales archaeon]